MRGQMRWNEKAPRWAGLIVNYRYLVVRFLSDQV